MLLFKIRRYTLVICCQPRYSVVMCCHKRVRTSIARASSEGDLLYEEMSRYQDIEPHNLLSRVVTLDGCVRYRIYSRAALAVTRL